jgi:hypothetical protein
LVLVVEVIQVEILELVVVEEEELFIPLRF